MKNGIIICIFCVLISSCKTRTDNNVKSASQTVEIYQSILDSIYQANPQSIGIIVHIEAPQNGISWSGSAGYSNKDTKAKLLPDQPVLIASNTKTYVATAILRLQEEGKLNIEDPIEKHLPQKTIALFQNKGYELAKYITKS